MTKAEERALEAYPVHKIGDQTSDYGEWDINRIERRSFQEGYEQAEKDIRSERTEKALLMETGIAARLSVLRGLAIKKGKDELANRIGEEIDYIYGLYLQTEQEEEK